MKLRALAVPVSPFLLLPLALGVVLVATSGCGDDSTGGGSTTQGSGASSNGGQGGGQTTGGAGGAGASGTGGEAPTNCAEGPDYSDAATTWDSQTVTANLVRLDGAPAGDVLTQLCGIDACYAIDNTDAQGNVILDNMGAVPLDTPAFKIGDGLLYAKVAHELPEGTLDHLYPDTLALELTDTAQPFPAGGEFSGGGVTFRLADDGVAEVDALFFPEPAQQTFRVVEVPPARIAEVVDASVGIEALYGFGPVDTKLCPPAALTIPNTPGWPAGAEVEFVLHGTEVGEEWAPYAGWGVVSTGTVTADGMNVETNEAEGIPILGVLGVRLAD
jgi:hypothetical protein